MKYVVTGTSSGLGCSIARKLIKHGDVLGLSRRNQDLSGDGDQRHKYTHFKADLSTSNVFDANSPIIFSLKELLKGDDFTLILNAGQFYSGAKRLEAAERTKLFWVNLFSIIDLVERLKLPNLRRIIFINSISGLIGQETQHEYAASKHGLMGYIRSLILEAKKTQYDVMVINPGGINTELWLEYPNIDNTSFLDLEELTDIIVNLASLKGRVFIPSFQILPAVDL